MLRKASIINLVRLLQDWISLSSLWNRCWCKIGRENVKTDNGLKSSLGLYVFCWIFCRRRHTENSSVEIWRGTLNVMLVLMLSWDWDAAQVIKVGIFKFSFQFCYWGYLSRNTLLTYITVICAYFLRKGFGRLISGATVTWTTRQM